MGRSNRQIGREFSRLQARTERMRALNRVWMVLVVMAACSAVVVSALPQWRKLGSMQAELGRSRAREALVMEQRDVLAIEQRALREDPAYLELKARDRLDYYREGERVYRIQRQR
jgi:cell division protein FtsB